MPDSCNYVKEGESTINVAFGFAISGVTFFSSLSIEKVDPFFPVYYDGNTNLQPERVDKCLMHPQAAGILHYHSASTCIADPDYIIDTPGGRTDVLEVIRTVYGDDLPYRSVLGISKDGRPIYSPLYDNGKEYTGCDVDICNGIEFDGHYSYVTTLFHPYIMGCYGPGSEPELYQGCSGNPRVCNIDYVELTEEEANGGGREMGANLNYFSLATLASLLMINLN